MVGLVRPGRLLSERREIRRSFLPGRVVIRARPGETPRRPFRGFGDMLMPRLLDSGNHAVSPVLPWIVAVTFFMQVLDGSILNNALPTMAGDLGVSPLDMHSVIFAYLLTSALFIPISGWLADRYSVRRVFSLAILLFTAGSLACAMAGTLGHLVAARVLQGLGGAMMVPVGRLAIVKVYTRQDLVRALSFVTLPGLLGPVCGPLVGGVFIEYLTWHWIFLINIPFGMVGLILSRLYMPELRGEAPEPFDLLGFMVFSLSLALLSLSFEVAEESPLVLTLALLGVGLLMMAAYWTKLAGRTGALFVSSIFKKPGFVTSICCNLCSRVGSGAIPFILPLFLQLLMGLTPLQAGLFMIPQAVGSLVGKSFAPCLLFRLGFRRFLLSNTCVLGLLVASFSLITVDSPKTWLTALFLVFGAFNSMQFTALNSLILIDLDHREAGSGNTLLSVVIQICNNSGVTLGAALLGAFAVFFQGGALSADAPSALIFHFSFFVVGVVILCAALVVRRLGRDYGRAAG